MEDIKYPNCVKCHVVVDLWTHGLVIDAYQKDGWNYYTFVCPHCGQVQMLPVEIQED